MPSEQSINPLYRRVHDWLWALAPRARRRQAMVQVARFVLALLGDLIEGEISLHAMSLVYTTLLSVVPFLALSFSVLKALGVHDDLQPFLVRMLEPLGVQAPVIAQQVIGFVDNVKVGVLGSVGIATLLYTAVSMISKIEDSFNSIWSIGHVRGFTQRFSEYLAVLLVGPLLIFSALGLTAAARNSDVVTRLSSVEPFGTAVLWVTQGAPYALIVLAFTFLYELVPNTQVRWRAAFAGGLFAGVAWESASAGFATFVAGSGRYSAIYSGFAIVIVLLIWLYVGWLIVLFGCRLAFYVQNPAYLKIMTPPPFPASREAEFLALRLFRLVGLQFLVGGPPLSADELRRTLAAVPADVERALASLVAGGILVETARANTFVPARGLATLTLAELWAAARGSIPGESALTEAGDLKVLAFLREAERQATVAGNSNVEAWLRSCE